MRALTFVTVVVLTASCATTQSIDVSQRSRTFNADFATTIKACLTYCEMQGFPVRMVNESMGVVATDYRESGVASSFYFAYDRAKLNFDIHRLDSANTTVVALISIDSRSYPGEAVTVAQTEDSYTYVFDAIKVCVENGNDIEAIQKAERQYAATIDSIQKAREGETVVHGTEIADTLGSLGINFHNKVVRSVIDGSPADRAGLRSDDILVSVDGFPLNGDDAEDTAKLNGTIGSTAHVVIQRGEKTLSLAMVRRSLQEIAR
ncbi:MAG TPA: PDZ domain-containing protein [Bacteroidota bacterium]|nr:PDZ domain-containing protein [Bacteroidota bacterium]